ncbi:MAG TPA: dsDNA nuclease domain-containing protein [Bradyrhizobium sp.]|nr:dsDNA nuclease domain-containing protein [Bradyrhizobium sp.]
MLSVEAMGGINAGKGFDFQTRFTACSLPVWLLEAAFHQLFYEGTGDIDVRFNVPGRVERVHIQVKDHEVTPAEFREVIANFKRLDGEQSGLYKCFTLVCPTLSAKLRPVETGLSRFRNAKPFYDDVADALTPTKDDLAKRLRKIGLAADDEIAFVLAKVSIEIGHGDLHHDDRAEDLFVGRLLTHPEYAAMIRKMVQPAFAELLRVIQSRRGAVLERSDIEQILRASVASVSSVEKGIALWVQNWTKEMFDLPADYALDWSALFDRPTRRVPPQDIWNNRLLPEIESLKKKILAERTERLIRFRGKCALSTGLAVGAAFPSVGGWIFEIPQPPSKEPWRSDAKPTNPNDLKVEVTEGGGSGTDLVLGFNIRGDGREDILRYIASTGHPPRLFVFMAPSIAPGSQSISGAEDAAAFARNAREQLGQIIKDHRISRTRLFFYGPLALAVFLGQQLTSVGEVELFEFQNPGYTPTCILRT